MGKSLKEINFPTRNVRGDFFMVVIIYFYNYYRYGFIYLFLFFFFLQIWCIYGIYGYECNKVVQCSQCNALLIDCCLCFSNVQTQRWLHWWVVYVVDVLFSMVRGSVKERGYKVQSSITRHHINTQLYAYRDIFHSDLIAHASTLASLSYWTGTRQHGNFLIHSILSK